MLKLGIIGLDTSHVTAFTKLLHDDSAEYHVSGARVVVAYPGGTQSFALSMNRVVGFTEELREGHGVEIVDSIEAVGEACDGILLESVDGRVHLEQFKKIANLGKPVFIDKPLAASVADAEAIIDLAKSSGTPLMSSSSLRFAEAFCRALETEGVGPVTGLDVYGPMALEAEMPGLFWYGVHCAEMLVTALGSDFGEMVGLHTEKHDLLTVRWQDGRLGTLRGNRCGNSNFGGTVHFKEKSVSYQINPATDRPFYASLLQKIIPFMEGKGNAAPGEGALAVVRLMEQGNQALEGLAR